MLDIFLKNIKSVTKMNHVSKNVIYLSLLKCSLKKRFERTGKEVQHCRLQKKVFLILFIRSSTISAVYSAGATSYGGQLWPLLC